MRRAALSEEDVLSAISRAAAPFSVYIGDVLRRDHAANVAKGGTGYGPSPALILRRLKQLAANGLIQRSTFPSGLYGYEWKVTDAGRAVIAEAA